MNAASREKPVWKNAKVLVVGLGVSGRAAARFLQKRGAIVTAVDRNDDLVNGNDEVGQLRHAGATILLQDQLKSVDTFDTIVLSPGIAPTHPLCVEADKAGIPMIGEVELALREVEIPCIGITGTNGKTTVTLLTTHVLNSSGKKAVALGNVGVPLADAVETLAEQGCQYAVIELSSFQIDTLHFPCLDVAALLNITPDHLDRYGTMEAYALSKSRISSLLKPNGVLFLYEDCEQEYPNLFKFSRVELYGYTPTCHIRAKGNTIFIEAEPVLELPSKYNTVRSHDVENIMASFAMCRRCGVTPEQFLDGLATFEKPRHRIEFVKQVRGVDFYDDSKGTNIDAVIRAVETLPGQIILIAGGVDKGAAYIPWIPVFKDRVKSICTIGEASSKIRGDLGGHYDVTAHATMEEAVRHAFMSARPGDTILLSPGCSSYDMFRDYAHRGEEFQRIVHSIS